MGCICNDLAHFIFGDAAGCGKILIRVMIKEGYDTRFAIAITACSSVMGVIIPPSILMVDWSGVMQITVGALFLAGAIPGLLIGFALMATVYGYAKVYDYPIALRPTFAEFWSAIKGAALFLFFGVFIDAIPTIIILGTVLLPVATAADIHPLLSQSSGSSRWPSDW